MDVVDIFSKELKKRVLRSPEKAERFLKLGWTFQNFRYRHFPVKDLKPSDRYLAHMMMTNMLMPLKTGNTAIVSAFTPCEMIIEAGLTPYNVESFSSYLSGSRIEDMCVAAAENAGLSDTLCSYHKIFIGAAILGIMPRPKCIVYTNVACDANMLTFMYLKELYDVPVFFLDIPYSRTPESVKRVEDELVRLRAFLEEVTGKEITDEGLKKRMKISYETVKNRKEFAALRKDISFPTDIVSPLYASMSANVYLGTEEELKYSELQLSDARSAAKRKGKLIYWMHVLPFWSDDMKKVFMFSDEFEICGCEIGDLFDGEPDPDDPIGSMSKRVVMNALNGSSLVRIENGIKNAVKRGASGVIWFNHWGCKHTCGCAGLAKKMFEEAGIPILIIDGDGADRKNGSEGQMLTRIQAFLEMLNG